MRSFDSMAEFIRPADTTAYTAGDVVGPTLAVIVFDYLGDPSESIVITDADIRIDVASVPAGMTSFRLHLYNASPASALADNAPWDLPAGDRAAYLGYVDLGTPVDVGSTLFVQTEGIGSKQIKMGVTSSLFGYLVTNGGFTPTSASVQAVRLNAREA